MSDLEVVRKRVGEIIKNKGYTYRDISLKIGRKDSYIQQYVKYGLPRRLNELDRKKLCQILNMNEDDLIDDELKSIGRILQYYPPIYDVYRHI